MKIWIVACLISGKWIKACLAVLLGSRVMFGDNLVEWQKSGQLFMRPILLHPDLTSKERMSKQRNSLARLPGLNTHSSARQLFRKILLYRENTFYIQHSIYREHILSITVARGGYMIRENILSIENTFYLSIPALGRLLRGSWQYSSVRRACKGKKLKKKK